MSKHTEGPWEVDYLAYTNTYRVIKVVNDSITDLEICGLRTYKFKPEVNKANAYLMAASPELLEVLEKVVHKSDWGTSGMHFLDAELRQQIDNAIKKAKGEM